MAQLLQDERTSGAGGYTPIVADTIVGLFEQRAAARPNAVALRHRSGGSWATISWNDYARAAREIAAGLRDLGLEAGDRVGILSGNRPEWHEADMGILSAGMVTVPVYATASATQARHVLGDSGSRVCFVEDGEQLAKVLLRRSDLPQLERVVLLGAVEGIDDSFVLPLADLRAAGAARLAADRDGAPAAVRPEQTATLVYTSGTTGPPKGAVISHANIMATLRSLTSLVTLAESDRFLSFLPLSHITERSVSHFGQNASGGETWFARSIATIPDDLPACRPTLFFAVPRVWEKFRDALLEAPASAPPPVRQLLSRYLELSELRGDRPTGWGTPSQELQHRALDATVGRLLRRRLGLDQARMLVSGAAAIHPDLLRWFDGLGLPIAEGYGQTEVSLCTSLNPVGAIRIGTVGKPIPDVEVVIAEDGEILVRGPNVCEGYWQMPEATAELIDADGWLHTGDLGSLDADGYLKVTGRKKDLIITAYGKNIAPAEIETQLRFEPLISQAVVVGENRPYLTALLTVDPDGAAQWAAQHGRSLSLGSVADDPAFRQAIDQAIERVNARHSHAEGIRHWRILPQDLTMEAGQLTPTLKVRREAVVAANRDLVEEMYA